jgi:mono/diheme cytochrome c family protein
LSEAVAHFADHCAICHANDGSGDSSIGKGLYPKPPDMRKAETQNLTDGELFYIIHNGVRLTGMPAFGEETSDKPDIDSWKLVHFIRHLPNITPEELEKMKGMNPKSPDEFREEEAIRKFLEGDDSASPPPGHKHD